MSRMPMPRGAFREIGFVLPALAVAAWLTAPGAALGQGFGAWGGTMGGADPFAGISETAADDRADEGDLPDLDDLPAAMGAIAAEPGDDWGQADQDQGSSANGAALVRDWNDHDDDPDPRFLFIMIDGQLVAIEL